MAGVFTQSPNPHRVDGASVLQNFDFRPCTACLHLENDLPTRRINTTRCKAWSESADVLGLEPCNHVTSVGSWKEAPYFAAEELHNPLEVEGTYPVYAL